jgi:hypothetical protein
MGVGLLADAKKPNGEPVEVEEEEDAPDRDLIERVEHFRALEFTEIEAWALARARVSWSECRERFLRRGATHETARHYFLGK